MPFNDGYAAEGRSGWAHPTLFPSAGNADPRLLWHCFVRVSHVFQKAGSVPPLLGADQS